MTADTMIIVAVVVIGALVLGGVWMVRKRHRRRALQARFGPEYDHAVRSAGSPAEAERALEARQKRVEKLPLRALSPAEVDELTEAWRRVQARFVDEPRAAVVDADRLITDAMRARGYPIGDPDRRLEDLSVDHADVVNHYRAGRGIVARHERGEASTEDLRQAMVHFRALFEDLVGSERHGVRRAS